MKIEDIKLTLSRDGITVLKKVRVSEIGSVDIRQLIWRSIEKAIREADRHIAARLHDKDWPLHCEFNSNFWGPMTKEDLAKIFL